MQPDTHYVKRLKLRWDPFSEDRTHYFFKDALRASLLEQLNHLCRYSNLVMLEGEPGVGKTALISAFESGLSESTDLIHISGSLLSSASDIAAFILDQLNLAVAVGVIESILQHLEIERDLGRHLLLVVDDADQLSEDALQLIDALSREDVAYFNVLLAGQEGFAEHAKGQVEFSAGISILRLEPMHPHRVSNYIEQQFEAAGLVGALPFSPEQLSSIGENSQGNIAKINAEVRQLLAVRPAVAVAPKKGLPLVPIFAASLLVTVGIYLAVSWMHSDEAASAPSRVESPQEADSGTEDQRVSESLRAMLAQTDNVESVEPKSAAGVLPQDEQIVPAGPGVSTEVPVEVSGSAEVSAEVPEIKEEKLVSFSPETVPLEMGVSIEPAMPVAEEQPVEVMENTVAPAVELEKVVEQPSSRQQVEAIDDAPQSPEQYLLSLDGQRFTVQLMADSSQALMRSMQSRNPQYSLMVVETLSKGKHWYILLYGDYASRTEANKAVEKLSGELGKLQPWVRRVAGVQRGLVDK